MAENEAPELLNRRVGHSPPDREVDMLNEIVGQFIESQNMKLCYQYWEENTETLIVEYINTVYKLRFLCETSTRIPELLILKYINSKYIDIQFFSINKI